jgi:hypothetical protein
MPNGCGSNLEGKLFPGGCSTLGADVAGVAAKTVSTGEATTAFDAVFPFSIEISATNGNESAESAIRLLQRR